MPASKTGGAGKWLKRRRSSQRAEDIVELGIGRLLFEARVAQGLSFEQVCQQTRIRPHILQAIELEDYGSLPQDVTGIGLISTYARFLAVNADRYLAQLEDLWELQGEPRLEREVSIVRSRNNWKPAVLAALGVFLFLGALTYILYQQYNEFLGQARGEKTIALIATPARSDQVERSVAPSSPLAIKSSSAPPANTATALPKPPTTTAVEPAAEVSIELRSRGRAWVQVTVDGKVDFSGIMNVGDRKRWVGRDSVNVWAGNAGFLTVLYNGRNIGELGAPGEIVRVSWTVPRSSPE